MSEVKVVGYAPALGEGTSKRAAEQAAATAFLKGNNVWTGTMDE